jgi:hypothetical protein
MRSIKGRYFALAGTLVAAGGLAFAAAPAAHADPAGIGVTHNTQGEAGYYANSNGQTRFRYVQTHVGVTNGIKNLNGSPTNPGALGVELCNPNTDYSIQLGVLWDGTKFAVQYGQGNLGAPIGGNDPCIQSGLVNGPGGHLHFLNGFTPVTGDQLSFAAFYNPRSHWVTLSACDINQDVCRNTSFNDGYQNLYEFGIGAVSNANFLTAPASNFLAAFSHCAANYYSSTTAFNRIFVPAHWSLKRSDFVNGSDQVIMSSNGSLNAGSTAFSLFNGSTSP